MIVKGDNLMAMKTISFLDKGDVIRVVDVNREIDAVSFVFGKRFEYKGIMSLKKCKKYLIKL